MGRRNASMDPPELDGTLENSSTKLYLHECARLVFDDPGKIDMNAMKSS